ncbi:hypothetical protein A6A08_23525 [Nocardiopsis sp. TSRI0078]|uniref:DUF2975 domain-containing protein n=1 Tax=unclassified Nocardiopsis TaxID=2649073 RepID=UPI0009393ABF|nr:DUF2975 domain-containing protein [Nocardiopsis sp. TSRI0078]OKI20191.1 hypothetical protein A6A08_23525 [Nocardiopsis sp. TSRI0078]
MSRWYHVRWSRADSVIVQVVLILGIGLTGLGMLLALAWTASLLPPGGGAVPDTITVRIPDEASEPRVGVATTGAVYETGPTGAIRLTFHDPTIAERLLLVAPGMLGATAALVVMAMVLRLIQSLDKGDPFVPANVRRVYTIAFTVLAASVLVPLTGMVCEGILRSRALGTDGFFLAVGASEGNGISLTHVFVGLVLAALAEVFRRGTRLREDVRGLV